MSRLVETVIQPRSYENPLENYFVTFFDTANMIQGFDTIAKIFTILFLITCFIVVIANIFKVGTWKKYAQVSATMSLLILIALRSLPFIFIAIPTFVQLDNWLNIILAVVIQCVVFVSLIGIVISFVFKLGYKLIEHPEFRKNAKMIFGISCIILVLAPILPIIII